MAKSQKIMGLPRHKRKQKVPFNYSPYATEPEEFDDDMLMDEGENLYKAPENLPAPREKSQIKVPLANSDMAFAQVLEEHSRS